MKTIYRALLVLCFISGIGLYASSLRYAWYTVSEQDLGQLSQSLEDKPRDERFREWYRQRKQLETPRKALHDTGIGLMAFAVTLAVFHVMTGFPLKDARTPKRKWSFVGIYWSAIVLQVPAAVYYLSHRQSRFEYPAWGDSIGIGLAGTIFGCMLFGIIGTLLFLAILWKTRFPADLLAWPGGQRVFNGIITVLFAVPAALCLIIITEPIRDGSIGGVVMTLTLLYLFLSARAGLVNYRAAEKNPSGEHRRRLAKEPAASCNMIKPRARPMALARARRSRATCGAIPRGGRRPPGGANCKGALPVEGMVGSICLFALGGHAACAATVGTATRDRDGRPIHVVWGIPKGQRTPAVVVTAYRPDAKRWTDDCLRRR